MSDFSIVRGHTLYVAGLRARPVVVDLGANQGEFARQMRSRFDATCYLAEANPALARSLRALDAVAVWECAVSDRDGAVAFHIAHNDEASTLLDLGSASVHGGGVRETVMVPARTLADLMAGVASAQVDLLKVDIEGAEVRVLGNVPVEVLKRMGQISVEFHSDAQFGFDIRRETEQVIRRLRRCGFVGLDFSYGSRCDFLFINRAFHRVGLARELMWRLRLHGPRWLRGAWLALPLRVRAILRGALDRATGIDRGA